MPRFQSSQQHFLIDLTQITTGTITVKRLGGFGDILLCAIVGNTLSQWSGLPIDFITRSKFHEFLLHFSSIKRCTTLKTWKSNPYPILFDFEEVGDAGLGPTLKSRWNLFADKMNVPFEPNSVRFTPLKSGLKLNQPFIGVVLKASSKHRTFSKMKSVAEKLRDVGQVAIINERAIKIPKHFIDLTGKSLCQVAKALEWCQVLVTPDTGLLHLAMFLRVPSVAIFAGINPAFRIWRPELVSVIQRSELSCCPCHEFLTHSCPPNKFLQCLNTVSVNEVVEKVVEFLKKKGDIKKGKNKSSLD